VSVKIDLPEGVAVCPNCGAIYPGSFQTYMHTSSQLLEGTKIRCAECFMCWTPEVWLNGLPEEKNDS
jgi:hypothetical protein